ncbi:30S ribosome-binding factor RbfA [Blochmannia endosymbiont of Polyrhachis (Hedomyrma) turneri]|uniref:30S ribosome-binding factor RbfA n=1 Tax=Blochmannia endosymbiont of Polyrhachis (Hedomyrma) turneri TaxID=1505596 RepID=UPI00061A54D4|nr:30S ribosome-binding factor RbfA [Blochmannia endosymbiont of Polyrhachis (Hedomyrma) turneri]AKC59690.1 Ribosome-binding factor A [Blochmannia endosymbiont of Polyrhachis (Hedomyrma) turneri]
MRDCNRICRISSEIRKNIAIILQFKIRDPRVAGIITVLGIDISSDLSFAKVFVTFLGNITVNQLDQKLKILRGASGFIRSSLARVMFLRIVPELLFIYDDSLSETMKVYHVLTKKISSM